jgi:hypothetical protein
MTAGVSSGFFYADASAEMAEHTLGVVACWRWLDDTGLARRVQASQ